MEVDRGSPNGRTPIQGRRAHLHKVSPGSFLKPQNFVPIVFVPSSGHAIARSLEDLKRSLDPR